MPTPAELEITHLNQLVFQLHQTGRYAEARELAFQVCETARQRLGVSHLLCAYSLGNLGVICHRLGELDRAEPLLWRALEVEINALGEWHTDVASSVNNIAELYREMGQYESADRLYRRAQRIVEATVGENHLLMAAILNNRAGLAEAQDDLAAAEKLHQRALAIRRSVVGDRHPDYAQSVHNLALLYRKMGNYAAAMPLDREALNVVRESLKEKPTEFTAILKNLALDYIKAGHAVAAVPLLQEEVEIFRQVVDTTHPEYAATLSLLAQLHEELVNYDAAEPLFREAIAAARASFEVDHPSIATCLNNFADFLHMMGNYAEAERLFQEAIKIGRNNSAVDTLPLATYLNNLAALLAAMDRGTDAQPLLLEARDILRTRVGEEHPDFAVTLDNLAGRYRKQGNYAAAKALTEQAREIFRRNFGEDNGHFATSSSNLAMIYYDTGNYAAAEPLFEEAHDILVRQGRGENHSSFIASLSNLSHLYAATNRPTKAMELMAQEAAIYDQMIGQVFSFGSETQRMAYLERIKGHVEVFLSLVLQYFSRSPTAVCEALDLVVRRKAIGAEALATQREAVLGGQYPELEPKLQELTILRMKIAQKTLAGPGPEGFAVYSQKLAEWNAQKERLEAELARHIPEMNLERKLRAADRQAVARAMPAGVALVEIVRFRFLDFQAVPARGEQRLKPAHYLAFVVPAGEPDNVHMVDLGEAEPIDRLITAFRESILHEGGDRALGRPRPKSVRSASIEKGLILRAALFDPLREPLSGRKRLLLAPDGDLTRLPFEVLPLDDGRLLMDEYHISYLSSGRDVLRFGVPSSGQPTAAIVVADPDFDLTSVTTATPAEVHGSLDPSAHFASSRQSRDLDRVNLRFSRLPGTRIEGEQIASMLGVQPWLAGAALESRLKACQSPRILHLATHGFFLADEYHDLNKVLHALGLQGWQTGGGMGRLSRPGLENPMLRSGMALAGANTWLKTGPLPPEAEDGLLTAEDVSGLNLLNTELVVLSACETGLGEVHTGEGVFGLRRAFVLAGAKTLIMSLWKVPDLSTAILMERLYDNLLHYNLPRDEALRKAQRDTRDITIGDIRDPWLSAEMIERLAAGNEKDKAELQELARRPDDHRPFSHPYYWGAFICQGDPAPLRRSLT